VQVDRFLVTYVSYTARLLIGRTWYSACIRLALRILCEFMSLARCWYAHRYMYMYILYLYLWMYTRMGGDLALNLGDGKKKFLGPNFRNFRMTFFRKNFVLTSKNFWWLSF